MSVAIPPADGVRAPSGFIHRLATLGHAPDDDADARRDKSIITLTVVAKTCMCPGWTIPFFLTGATLAALAPLAYQIITVVSLILFARNKSMDGFRFRQTLFILILPAVVHFALGGFAASSTVILWSFLAPLGSLLFDGPRQSVRWLVAFAALIVFAVVQEIVYPLPVVELPRWLQVAFFGMGILCVTGITYAATRYYAFLLDKEKEVQELLNEELIHANEHKSAFLASMSHELRTPLNAIIGFTRVVKRRGAKVLPEKQVENLDKVLTSADHLLGLINTILDIAKIEAGKVTVEPRECECGDLVRDVVGTSEPLLKPGVEVDVQIADDLPPLFTDPDKIKQILLNLMSNAAKFTHQGRITVAARRRAGRGELIQIDVTDTGIGISEEAMGRVFQEFQQADSSTTREYGGTGLGLSISRRLARLLGGELSATSVEGQGSTFTLTFASAYGESAPRERKASAPKPRADRVLVLSIDDNADAIFLTKDNLEGSQFEVISALGGAEGLEKARLLRPSAITLDVKMSPMDGWQTLERLKADPQTKDIPVLMLTITDEKEKAKSLGAAGFMTKPAKPEALIAELTRLCGARVGGEA